MAAPKEYTRLPGTGYRQTTPVWTQFLAFFVVGFFALLIRGKRVQLWQGRDHILQVDSDGASEDYKRFYYQDIQAFVVRRTPLGLAYNALFGSFLFLFAIMGVMAVGAPERWTMFILGAIFLGLLLWNILSGPTCETYLLTAVQQELLASVGRLRAARALIARLKPLIESLQGPVAVEESAARYTATSNLPPVIAPAATYWAPPLIVPYDSKVHAIMSVVAAADLVGTPLTMAFSHEGASVYSAWHILILIGTSITALFRQKNTDLPRGLRRLPYILLGGIGFCFVAGIAHGIFLSFNNAPVIGGVWQGDIWNNALTVISTLTNGIGGIWGWFALKRYRRERLQATTDLPPAIPPMFPASMPAAVAAPTAMDELPPPPPMAPDPAPPVLPPVIPPPPPDAGSTPPSGGM